MSETSSSFSVPRRRLWLRRAIGVTTGIVGFVLIAAFGMGCWVFAGPRYQGPASDHFDGTKFFTPGAPERSKNIVRWMLTRKQGAWGPYRDVPPGPPPPRLVSDGKMRVTFVNHATSLIQLDGVNVLTDPIWSERCSPVGFVGPSRVRPPGIRFEDLPPVDVVLVSHNHYDHMDLVTLKRLAREHRPRFVVGLGNAKLLRDAGIGPVEEVDWWQGVPIGHGVTVYSVPVQHFSNRGLSDMDTTLWTGFLVKGPSGGAYFAGDTGFGAHFAEVRKRFGPPRVALLPIGAFRPEWFMGPIHMSPRQAVEAHSELGAGLSLAIHFGTFPLADDGENEAPDLLRSEMAHAAPGTHPFLVPGFGEGYDVPPLAE